MKLTEHPRWIGVLQYEWDYEKNTIHPESLTHGCHTKVHWKCLEGHMWEATINKRIIGTGCSTCSRVPRLYDEKGQITHKKCCTCKKMLSVDEFFVSKYQPDGRVPQCRSCRSKRTRQLKYNLSHEMLTILNKVKCMVCKSTENICVDHCHTSGKTRGFLCKTCNTALGYMKDDPKLIENLLIYAKYWANVLEQEGGVSNE